MRYLLGTNIVSDLIRNPQGRVAEQTRQIGEQKVCTSIIVAAELRYGARRKASPRLTEQVEAVLGAMDVLPFEAPRRCSLRNDPRSACEGWQTHWRQRPAHSCSGHRTWLHSRYRQSKGVRPYRRSHLRELVTEAMTTMGNKQSLKQL